MGEERQRDETARGRVGTIPEPSDGRFESPDPRSARRLPAPSRLADARAFSSPPSPRVDPRRVDERFDSDAGVFSPPRARRGASAALADGCLLGAFVSPETFVSALASRLASALASALAPASVLTFFAFAFALAFARVLASSAFARVSSASIAATAAMAASTSAASAASASASSANMARSPVAGSTRSGTYHPETRAARAARDARASSSRTISINDGDFAAAGERAGGVPVSSAR